MEQNSETEITIRRTEDEVVGDARTEERAEQEQRRLAVQRKILFPIHQ